MNPDKIAELTAEREKHLELQKLCGNFRKIM